MSDLALPSWPRCARQASGAARFLVGGAEGPVARDGYGGAARRKRAERPS